MERKLIREVQNNPKTSAEKIRVMWNSFSTTNGVSAKAIRGVLHKYGIRGRSAAKTIATLNRIRWCKQRKTWSVVDWKRIMFTVEVRFRQFSDGRVAVWRRNSKRFDPSCVVSKSTDKRLIMVCAIVRSDGQTMLIKCLDRMKSDDYVRILHQALGDVITDEVILQHDNCPVPKAEIVNDWLRDNQILAIGWPSYSPDLNLIENVRQLWNIEFLNSFLHSTTSKKLFKWTGVLLH